MINNDVFGHHKVDDVATALNQGRNLSFWLAKSPYMEANGYRYNMSKSLEHEIIRKYSPKWNKRNNR